MTTAEGSRTIRADQLSPGDTFYGPGDVRVTVVTAQEAAPNRFGMPWFRYLCRREDTGEEGYMSFGPEGVVRV